MALKEISRQKPLLQNWGEPRLEKAMVDFAIKKPACGQLRVSHKLKQPGVLVPPGGVLSIRRRLDPETSRQRLPALERLNLPQEQLRAWEPSKAEKEACGEMDTRHPGCPGAQDPAISAPSKA